ncbi:PadR family transcriptional regulator [Iningainema tapete]|uniref:PadR family transcriptional regulator n=1 Tax=Iningainema tapete BLCC-T55 TaxID=2748662 RepID=A0A8J6XKE0_9CYAN|nr:PadR family transcriptional regulator [Iningainema tapete]MBD2776258.1 PadR family transcriptional regulator [Iningainema tapete BLCC-T55]
MSRENKSKYAILGILSFGPKSGYDIKKKIETSTSNFWSESYGQIYPILKKLVEEGLATQAVEEQVGKPNRHVYQLTEKGQQELQQWLTEPVEPQVERIEILLKLFFGQQVSVADNIRHVQKFRDLQQELLQKYQAMEVQLKQHHKADNPNIPYWSIIISYKLHVTSSLINWCEQTLVNLNQLAEAKQDAQDVRT